MEIEKKEILSTITAVEELIRNEKPEEALRELAILRKEINKKIEI
jgi:hypothetical protein